MPKKGYKQTKEHIKNVRIGMGEISEETKEKMSKSHTGRRHSKETKEKMSKSQKKVQHWTGHKNFTQPHTFESRQKISNALKGNKNPNWKGGIKHEKKYCYKFNDTLRQQIRDKYMNKCFLCNKTKEENGMELDVHHIDYNKDQGCNNEHDWKLIPLCRSCHMKTNGNKTNRKKYKRHIQVLLEIIGE